MPAPARIGDHRHVDVRDRREQQRVLAPDELRHLLLDLLVQDRASEEPRPGRVRAPSVEVLGHRVDDLPIEVEPQVVARGEVEEPAVADPDPPPVLLVDHRVEHRMGVLQPSQVGDGLHPAIEPSVSFAPERLRTDRTAHDGVGRPATWVVGLPASEHGCAGSAFSQRHADCIGRMGEGLYTYKEVFITEPEHGSSTCASAPVIPAPRRLRVYPRWGTRTGSAASEIGPESPPRRPPPADPRSRRLGPSRRRSAGVLGPPGAATAARAGGLRSRT